MKFTLFFVSTLLVYMGSLGPALAAVEDDPIANAVFASDIRTESPSKNLQGIGLVVFDSDGYGIVYSRQINILRTAWVRGTYSFDRYIFLQDYEKSSEVANIEVHKTMQVQIASGIDQIFHVTKNHRWGFVLGLGAGLNQSEYESKYYRELCTFFCGYDPRSPVTKNQTDSYAFALGTIGVKFVDTQVWNLKGNFKIAMTPELFRTGSFAFRGPDGREFKPLDSMPYTLEALVTF